MRTLEDLADCVKAAGVAARQVLSGSWPSNVEFDYLVGMFWGWCGRGEILGRGVGSVPVCQAACANINYTLLLLCGDSDTSADKPLLLLRC